jgi:cell division protein FtsQ
MARKSSPTIVQEELYPSNDESARPDLDDARMLDIDGEQESPFLRGQKRVSARRGPIPKKTANRLKWVLIAIFALGVAVFALSAGYRYSEHSWRFRIQSSDDIEVSGNHNVTHAQIMEVMGGDIGRNIFFVPLAQRRSQLEQIPWVNSASVMRFIPNHLRVEIHERTPVAFARIGSKILLADAGGTLMELPSGNKTRYSFPVILGMNNGEPLSTRSARMQIYNDLMKALDSSGAHYSQDLSEVDLSDPDDVKVLANDPQGAVLVHLGSTNFLDRYKVFVSHVREWRQQFEKLESVDLRYDRQIVVNPDLASAQKQAPLSASAARIAAAAGVKKAALVSHIAGSARTANPGTGGLSAWKKTSVQQARIGPEPPPIPAAVPLDKPSSPNKANAAPKWKRSNAAHHKSVARKHVAAKSSAASKKSQVSPAGLKTPMAVPKTKKPSPAIPKDQGKQ